MKVKMKDINLTEVVGTNIYVDIDVFRFTKDKDLSYVEILIDNNGEWEFLEEVHASIIDHEDLRKFALNWIFKSVEITNGTVGGDKSETIKHS